MEDAWGIQSSINIFRRRCKAVLLKIFLKLIGRMEMTNGIIGQMEGVKTEGKVELDHEKMNLLKSKLML